MTTQVWQLRGYVKALEESHLEGSLKTSCLKAKLADIKGEVVYFRNYEDTNLEYIEFCFTRMVGKIKFNYVSYVEWDDSM